MLVALAFFVIYRLTHADYSRSHAKSTLPFHFTIPVLSPFASVVSLRTELGDPNSERVARLNTNHLC